METPTKTTPEWPVWQRVLCVWAGTVLPILRLGCAFFGIPEGAKYQDGKFSTYVRLMLVGSGSWPMYLVLLYAMVSLTCLVSSFDRFVRLWWVRLGVYCGTLFALQFVVMSFLTDGFLDSPDGALLAMQWLLLCCVIFGFLLLLHWIHQKRGSRTVWTVVFGFYGVVAVITFLMNVSSNGLGALPVAVFLPVFVSFVLMVIIAPFAMLFAYIATTQRILAVRGGVTWPLTRIQVMGLITWIVGYLSMLRWSVTVAIDEYSKLPLESPDRCYIATAANQGHPWFVGSREVSCRDGSVRRVNLQLRRFKMAEIALATLLPKTHRVLRFIYDRVGPPLARPLRMASLADLAYLLLKPVEWCAAICLRLLVGKFDVSQLYRGDEQS